MLIKVLYRTDATATGGRTGTVKVADGSLTLSLATPKELGGTGGPGANPEQLFASGYAACLLSAIRFVAGRRKQTLSDDSSVTASVGIGPRADGAGFSLDVALTVSLPGMAKEIASELVEEAHATCPYSHLAREGTSVRLTVV